MAAKKIVKATVKMPKKVTPEKKKPVAKKAERKA